MGGLVKCKTKSEKSKVILILALFCYMLQATCYMKKEYISYAKKIAKSDGSCDSLFLILHNIRSIHNVGSIFRTADACGVDKIFLTGYTPIPVDRFGRDVKALSKVSLGAEKTVPWEKFSNIKKLIEKLQKEGVSIVALEQDDRSVNYKKFKPKFPLALIVGNEVRGISKDILSLCDSIIEIPMRGEKESLNVSVATGIALFSIKS